jgi:hypothetical protein
MGWDSGCSLRPDGTIERVDIAAFERDLSSHDPGNLGLRLAEAKDLLQALQTHLVQDQVQQLSATGGLASGADRDALCMIIAGDMSILYSAGSRCGYRVGGPVLASRPVCSGGPGRVIRSRR